MELLGAKVAVKELPLTRQPDGFDADGEHPE